MAHLTLLLVLLWVGTTVSTVVDVHKRIIGGGDCNPDERLYHVQLVDKNNNFICGGSLINDQWILTVEHCWVEGLSVILGAHPGEKQQAPKKIKRKKTYKKGFFFKKKHDIMLLKLPERTQGLDQIQTVNPDDCKARPGLGVLVQIAGNTVNPPGETNLSLSQYSQTLQCANINVADCGDVTQITRETKSTPDHWFCGHTTGVSSCCGDSGGGVVYRGRLYGLIRGSGPLLNDLPVRFINLCHKDYLKWIKKTAGLKQ